MIKSVDFPGKTFANREDLFAALKANEEKIKALKRASVVKVAHIGVGPMPFLDKIALVDGAEKAAGWATKEGFIYPVINTTNYMDSHMDVHFPGIWDKSLNQQKGKLFYVMDHSLKLNDVIAWPDDVNAMVKTIPWSFLGKEYPGNTQALIYEIAKDRIVSDVARKTIDEKRPVQNSVRMQYVKIRLGMDSNVAEDKAYKEYYDSRIGEIANSDVVKEYGYFWGIEEAKIDREGSMVLFGSNDVTPVKSEEAVADTSDSNNSGPVKTTQEEQTVNKFFNSNLY